MGISLSITGGSAYLGPAHASDRNPSRILTVALGLIFTGKVFLLLNLWNKKLLPKTEGLKLSVLYFDPVILHDTSIETETSMGLFAKECKNVVCFPIFLQLQETEDQGFGY